MHVADTLSRRHILHSEKMPFSRTRRAFVHPLRRNRSDEYRQNQFAHSIPRKFTSGRVLACSVMNVPFPMPISISTGCELPNTESQFSGLGSWSTSSAIDPGLSGCLLCITKSIELDRISYTRGCYCRHNGCLLPLRRGRNNLPHRPTIHICQLFASPTIVFLPNNT